MKKILLTLFMAISSLTVFGSMDQLVIPSQPDGGGVEYVYTLKLQKHFGGEKGYVIVGGRSDEDLYPDSFRENCFGTINVSMLTDEKIAKFIFNKMDDGFYRIYCVNDSVTPVVYAKEIDNWYVGTVQRLVHNNRMFAENDKWTLEEYGESAFRIHPNSNFSSGWDAFGMIGDSTIHTRGDIGLYRLGGDIVYPELVEIRGAGNTLTVTLPADSIVFYKNTTLTIEGKNGQRLQYIVTDKDSYTFRGLAESAYNITLKTSTGIVLASKEGVWIDEKDKTVELDGIKMPINVTLTLLDATATDVTSHGQISWFDGNGNFLKQSNALSCVTSGMSLYYKVELDKEFGTTYAFPEYAAYDVAEGKNDIVLHLQPLQNKIVSATVKDTSSGEPLGGASVNVRQMLNGKYVVLSSCKTDADGHFSIDLYNDSTSITVSMADHLAYKMSIDRFDGHENLGDIMLEPITGNTLVTSFIYTKCPKAGGMEPEMQEWYDDTDNVSYSIYNKTKGKQVTDFSLQYPSIVLLDNTEPGDSLAVTAESKTGGFNSVTVGVVVSDAGNTKITLPIVQRGAIEATFKSTANDAVSGTLYDDKGKFVGKYAYNGVSLRIGSLADGDYTLVTMGDSHLYNSVYSLDELESIGLEANTDYLIDVIHVESGKLSCVDHDEVPEFDESRLRYTGANTMFSANKGRVVIGNYLTLESRLDFKDEYADGVSNVCMVYDIPESVKFIENSLMVGSSVAGYTLEGNKLTVSLPDYGEKVRFCVIPTQSGTFAPNAFVRFDIAGKTVMQPTGSATYAATGLSINVPKVITQEKIPLTGIAMGKGKVEIYANNMPIGEAISLANGTWSTTCHLDNLYNMSTYSIYAKVTTDSGLELLSETKDCTYDMDAVQVSTVKMYHHNPESNNWRGKTYEVVFDFLNPSTKSQNYVYYIYDKSFTFTVDFVQNDTTRIKNVKLLVKTGCGNEVTLNAIYDKEKCLWVANGDFGNRYDGDIPVNVSVIYDVITGGMSMESYLSMVSNPDAKPVEGFDMGKAEDYVATVDDDGTVNLEYTGNGAPDIYVKSIYTSGFNSVVKFRMGDKEYDSEISVLPSGDDGKYSDEFAVNDGFHFKRNVEEKDVAGDEDGIRKITCKVKIPRNKVEELKHLSEKPVSDDKSLENLNNILRASEGSDSVTVRVDIPRKAKQYYTDVEDEQLRELLNCYRKCGADDGLIDYIANIAVSLQNDNNEINFIRGLLQAIGNICNGISRINDNQEVTSGLNAASQACNTAEMGVHIGQAEGNYVQNLALRQNIMALENNYGGGCKCPTYDDYRNRRIVVSTCPDAEYSIDPSGYVYEGVPTNRLQGVTATAYYKVMEEDMYGDKHEVVRLWNAADYGQENPLITDGQGFYRWDVPQGMWQVKFEKEGYETVYSEWLPVPPPQLDINIAMRQYVQPEVDDAKAYTGGIEIGFSKYMVADLLNTDNIRVEQEDGIMVEGRVEMLDMESDGKIAMASKVKFIPSIPFHSKQVLKLTVDSKVESYVGIQMSEDYNVELEVNEEVTAIETDPFVRVLYGGWKELTVTATPAAVAAGKTLIVHSSSGMIATVESEAVVLDSNGQAVVRLKGVLPGRSVLTMQVDGTNVVSKADILVGEASMVMTMTPKASLVSGITVESGTWVELLCDTPGASIYYTIDGSCPCDDTKRMLYTGPIMLSNDVTIKAMAVHPELGESDIVEFTYKVMPASGIENIAYGDNVVRIKPMNGRVMVSGCSGCSITVYNMRGMVVRKVAVPSSDTVNISLPKGIFVVHVGGTVRKVRVD